MRLVGTQARGCPPLFTARRLVSALIIIKPSLLQIKARGLRAHSPSFTPGRGGINRSLQEPAVENAGPEVCVDSQGRQSATRQDEELQPPRR
ncbi:uncharacterized protein AKAME5_001069200 [Lates japonicus]|uniref:Uncharacterized protein n=1 Tax=Lates japonicus TaxID=270547 RepID=A0AAD3R7L0_LATJO|nr:uncharacterized protein AKAME5_001069200 [Lates japonicus]